MGRFPADEPVVREPQTLCREPDEDVPRYRPPRDGVLWLQAGQIDVEQFRPRLDDMAAQQSLCRTHDPAACGRHRGVQLCLDRRFPADAGETAHQSFVMKNTKKTTTTTI